MRATHLIILAAIMQFTCLCFYATATEEVLFKRKMTEEEANYFVISTSEMDINRRYKIETWDQEHIDWLKHQYRNLSGPTYVKVVYVYDSDTKRPILMKITRRTVKCAAVIYERELPKEEVEQYSLDVTGAASPPDDATLQEIREQYNKEYWDKEWGVQKVRVFFCGAYSGKYDTDPHLRVTRLKGPPKKTEAEKKQEAEWIKWAGKNLAHGKDAAGFTHLETEFKITIKDDYEHAGPTEYGRVTELFRNLADTGDIKATIAVWPGDAVPEHELLRRVMQADYYARFGTRFLAPVKTKGIRLKKTRIGRVLVLDYRKMAGLTIPRWARGTEMLWTWRNCIIAVSGLDTTSKHILKLYGDKFPSSVSKKLDLDKTKWYRAEVEMILARLKELVPVDKPTRIDWFSSNFNKLLNTVELPQYKIGAAKKAGVEKKQELYDALTAWWEQNKDDARWSKETGKLKAKDD